MLDDIVMSLDMHTQNNWETSVRILNALRVVFPRDEWTLTHEGHWEEFTRPSGIYYSPDGGYTFPNNDNDDADINSADDAQVHIDALISQWEAELYDFGYSAYADGENGMYWVERINGHNDSGCSCTNPHCQA